MTAAATVMVRPPGTLRFSGTRTKPQSTSAPGGNVSAGHAIGWNAGGGGGAAPATVTTAATLRALLMTASHSVRRMRTACAPGGHWYRTRLELADGCAAHDHRPNRVDGVYSWDRRRLIFGAIIALVVVAAVAVYFTVFRTTTHSESGIASDVKKTIAVDGVELAAEVITPRGVAHPPLIVMPGSFGGAPSTLHQVSLLFARRGYLVVAYAQRGFGGSTGESDFGGPDTQRDARGVITWALDNTAADPKR